ncbi:hypothetical protein ABHV46_01650 [Asaia sp. BMEF1]|uniref:hypothetical protein n=1 Tax=Asaia sp. BMEF1 TaxID=3155932 RepID=UPI003F663B27
MTFFLVLRGFTPVQASETGCAPMVSTLGAPIASSETGCGDHHEAPVSHHGHSHGCGSCLPSPSCLSSFDAPIAIALATPGLSDVARFETTPPPALAERRAPPDLRPPRFFLTL